MSRLTIDLGKIEENARLVAGLLEPHGVRLVGVTKACLGNALVGQAMLDGGARSLADSRLENIATLRRQLPEAQLELLRPIATEPAARPAADLFFVTSLTGARTLRSACPGGPLRLCLMIETGDGREGVPAGQAAETALRIVEMPEVELAGLATNAACARRGASLRAALENFTDAAARLLPRLGRGAPELMSLGGSGFLRLLPLGNSKPAAGSGRGAGPLGPATELRSGEAILLGRIPAGGSDEIFLPGAHRDAFVIEAEVLEVYKKEGERQALLDIGLQDLGPVDLVPQDEGVQPRAATSDYLAVACPGGSTNIQKYINVGSRLTFVPRYYSLLAAMTSPFVEKAYV